MSVNEAREKAAGPGHTGLHGTSVPKALAGLADKLHVDTLPREQIATKEERRRIASQKDKRAADTTRLLADRYIRSYAVIRTCVGFIGILLPIALMIGESFFAGSVTRRGSISAYYHSPMQDLFVAALSIVAFLLLTYMSGQMTTADYWVSTLAGIMLLGVVFLPTLRPGVEGTGGPFCGPGTNPEPSGCSALESTFGEKTIATVHATCATIFILSLAVICCCFAYRDRTKGRGAWRWITQLGCAAAIIGACLWVVLGPDGWLTALYVGEVVSVWAFGVSWFIAGYPLHLLRGKPLPS